MRRFDEAENDKAISSRGKYDMVVTPKLSILNTIMITHEQRYAHAEAIRYPSNRHCTI